MPSSTAAATPPAPAAPDDDRSPLADEDGTEDDLDSDGSGTGGEDEPLASPTADPVPEGGALRVIPISSALPSEFLSPSGGGRPPVVHRLWTDEDEIAFLQGFYEYTSRRGTTGRRAPRHGVRPFFEEIRARLQLGFNKSQLVEKLRRLKKKYRLTVARMASGKGFTFRSPHDSKAFEISSMIWSHTASGSAGEAEQLLRRARRRRRKAAPAPAPDDDAAIPTAATTAVAPAAPDAATVAAAATISEMAEATVAEVEMPMESAEVELKAAVQSLEREPPVVVALPAPATTLPPPTNPATVDAVRSSATPPIKEATPQHAGVDGPSTPPVTRSGGGGDTHVDTGIPLPPSFADGFEKAAVAAAAAASAAAATAMEGKWRDQMILELEVYSKRLELAQEQIKLTIQELRRPPSTV